MSEVRRAAEAARDAARLVATLTTEKKNDYLRDLAGALVAAEEDILRANAADITRAEEDGLSTPKLKRLGITAESLGQMAEGLRQVADLEDPVAKVTRDQTLENGLRVTRVRCPLGVVMMIYESRPNVTMDAASLCLKSGNACILRGGSEAIRSNQAIAACIEQGLLAAELPVGAVHLVQTADRAAVGELLELTEYVDVLVPRGGKGLIERVARSSIPVIKHLDGVCHVYIDDSADPDMAVSIAVNSKTEKYAVCNAMETLLVSDAIAATVLPLLAARFGQSGVEMRGCEKTCAVLPDISAADEEDWTTEYLGPILAIRTVEGLDEAVEHINTYGSQHTDVIVGANYANNRRFLSEVDSASVMVNTSTQFADGFEFGLGAEIGISTDKLHARGPVGLEGLTTQKFVVFGNGEIRHR